MNDEKLNKHEWSDYLVYLVNNPELTIESKITLGVKRGVTASLNASDSKAIANHFNLFDDYVSVDEINREIGKLKFILNDLAGHEKSNVFIIVDNQRKCLEKLIKPKDKQ